MASGCERPPAAAATACLENLRQYRDHSNREVARVKRNLFGLSDDDKASLIRKPEEQVETMEEAAAANLAVLDKLEELLRKELPSADSGPCANCTPGAKPVQVLLATLVRDWSAEGLEERKECFDKLLGALDGIYKDQLDKAVASKQAPPRVLVPGCSLGRLSFEVASRGYNCEACDSRLLHWFGMELIRQHGSQAEVLQPQPYALNTCNRLKFTDNHRVTAMPEVSIQEGMLPYQRFGDFTKLYDRLEAKGSFDGLLTAYSLDLSPNVFRFVRTAAHVVKPGGLWANFGPLAYDADHDEAAGHGLELSWEELRFAISHFFEVQKEEWVDALCAQNAESLMQMQYTCIYFQAVRNTTPAPGIGDKSSI